MMVGKKVPKFLVFVGQSFVGKTSLVGRLLLRFVFLRLVLSLTTRDARSSDLFGGYEKVSPNKLKRMNKNGLLAWLVDRKEGHGNMYGTTVESILSALSFEGISVMILNLKKLRKLISLVGREAVLPVFVFVNDIVVLRKRGFERGDLPKVVERRTADCKQWLRNARRGKIEYVFVDNSGDIDTALNKIIRALPTWFLEKETTFSETAEMTWIDDGGRP